MARANKEALIDLLDEADLGSAYSEIKTMVSDYRRDYEERKNDFAEIKDEYGPTLMTVERETKKWDYVFRNEDGSTPKWYHHLTDEIRPKTYGELIRAGIEDILYDFASETLGDDDDDYHDEAIGDWILEATDTTVFVFFGFDSPDLIRRI